MKRLARKADVFANSYRPGVNKRFGLLPAELAAKSERGIVCMTANAYGHSGPWTERPGFDQNGQVASGFASKGGEPDKPRFSPVFYLADLMTGHFAAAGMMAALLRRSIEGGSYNVKVSLTRSAVWVQDSDSYRWISSLPLRQKTSIHRSSAQSIRSTHHCLSSPRRFASRISSFQSPPSLSLIALALPDEQSPLLECARSQQSRRTGSKHNSDQTNASGGSESQRRRNRNC
jgi:hypothetical protein